MSACSVNDWLFYVVIVLFVFVYNSLVMICFTFFLTAGILQSLKIIQSHVKLWFLLFYEAIKKIREGMQ